MNCLKIKMSYAILLRNIQALLIEVCKMKNKLASPIIRSMLYRRINNYNLKNFHEIVRDTKKNVWSKRNLKELACSGCPYK